MASFAEHIEQVRRNLRFLSSINNAVSDCFDWQVTVCFYTALHLVNAHLSQYNLQYRKHHDVNYALNPHVQLSPGKLPEEQYEAYISLQRLSRRSRYLVNEKDSNIGSTQAFLTYDKHLSKAVRHLDGLLQFFEAKYAMGLTPVRFHCAGLTAQDQLRYFKFS